MGQIGSNFNVQDKGIPVNYTPTNTPIPSGATNLQLIFVGQNTGTKVGPFSATWFNNGPGVPGNPSQTTYAQYTTSGTDFLIPDIYQVQLLYSNAGSNFSSDSPHPTITVGQRLSLL